MLRAGDKNNKKTAVQNQGANEMTRTLVHTVRTLSWRALMVKICGDRLPARAGVHPEWVKNVAEVMVAKAMPGGVKETLRGEEVSTSLENG